MYTTKDQTFIRGKVQIVRTGSLTQPLKHIYFYTKSSRECFEMMTEETLWGALKKQVIPKFDQIYWTEMSLYMAVDFFFSTLPFLSTFEHHFKH